ncbi:MAG: exodeoxyribonuclease VII small subunit [Bacteroidia bacterium]|nr:exodeoxyribonuclease VII small subunit [Bacteroidia bacterium]
MAEQNIPETFSLEEKLENLRKILEQMQKGMSDFDRQMALFKQGQLLISECRQYLDKAELQVDQLLGT